MSQSDFIIENQSGSQFRRDVQSALQAAVSSSIGRAAPTTTYAGQIWFDSEENELKVRNEGNNAWIVFADTNSVLNHIRLRTSVLRSVDRRGITLEALNGADLLRVTESGDVSGAAIATAAEIRAKTANNKLLKVGDLPPNNTWDYESPELQIISQRFFHGLGARPKDIGLFLVTKRTNNGWDVGTEIKIASSASGKNAPGPREEPGVLNGIIAYTSDTTRIGVAVARNGIILFSPADGNFVNVTSDNFKLIVRAAL